MKPCVDPITGLRMKPSALAVLNRLRLGPATTHDLGQSDVGGFRFGARLLELRHECGFTIDEQKISRSSSLYSLAEPQSSVPPESRRGSGTSSREAKSPSRPSAAPEGQSLFDLTPYTERVAA